MTFLSRLSNGVERTLDAFGAIPDALATFLMALATILGTIVGIALVLGLGYVMFQMSPVAGWVYVVLGCAVAGAAAYTLDEHF